MRGPVLDRYSTMFDSLPDTARTWIFTADRALTPVESAELVARIHAFVQSWTSHGRPVPAEVALLHDRFLVVAARIDDEPNAGVSGCGIDAMTRAVEEAGAAADVAWMGGLHVAFRDENGHVSILPRPAFRQLARDGDVTAATPVFDTTITSLGILRADGLERPAADSWHGHVFRLKEPA